jgi:hypothetical protein
MFLRSLATVLALFPMVTACAQADGNHSGAASRRGGPPRELIARATVLEDRSHGPQLCLGGILESLPPQCGGPDLIGWDWDAVAGVEQAGDTRWGEFVVIGTYDQAAGTFTLTRPAVPAEEYDGSGLPTGRDLGTDLRTPCPAPEGGWRVVDPALTSEDNLSQTIQSAQARPDFGGLWVDQPINPASTDGDTADDERRLNDPTRLIVNVAVTGDPEAAEADLRHTWGGALCVSRAEHTERELRRIQDRMSSLPDFLTSAVANDRVAVTVVWDDGSLQAALDERYGAGVIVVTPALQPLRS